MTDPTPASSRSISQRLVPRFTYTRTPTLQMPMPTLPERIILPDLKILDVFDIRIATDDETEALAFSVRWDVYCRELGFEPAERFPDHQESDADDQRSVQVVAIHRRTGRPAGCFRLLLADPADIRRPFHVEAVCSGLLKGVIPTVGQARLGYAELSRFCIIAPFRHFDASVEAPPWGISRDDWNAEAPLHRGLAGLMWLVAAQVAVKLRLDYLLTLMESRLQTLGKVMGMNFLSIGEPVEFRGMRVPYRIDRRSLASLLTVPQTARLLRPLEAAIDDAIRIHPLLVSYMDSHTGRFGR